LPSPVTINRPVAFANEIGGTGKSRAEIGLQRRRYRRDAAALGIEGTQGRRNG